MAKEDNITSYFPHDSNARNSDKLIRLRMRHKAAGYGVYFMILERLREEQDYMSIKDYNIIAFDLREDASLIKSVVEEFGLFVFTEDGKYFYSESFKRRMELKDEKKRRRSEAGKKGMANRWNENDSAESVSSGNDNNVITNDNNVITKGGNVITSKEKESKEKESKEEKNKAKKKDAAIAATQQRKKEFYDLLIPYVDMYGKVMIRAFFDYWTETNKTQTKMRFEQQKTWDLNLRLRNWASRERIDHKPSKPNIVNHDNTKQYTEF